MADEHLVIVLVLAGMDALLTGKRPHLVGQALVLDEALMGADALDEETFADGKNTERLSKKALTDFRPPCQ